MSEEFSDKPVDRLAEEVRAARERARASQPKRVSRPDPADLPSLPPSGLESAPPDDALVEEHLPDDFLYTPPQSFPVWSDIWQRDVGFRVSSHRGGFGGRAIVAAKRLLSKFFRAPLSAELQRQRVFNIAVSQHLDRQMAEVRRYLLDVRSPYSFVRDKAVPDLIARADALYSVLDRRIDALEAELRRHREEASYHAAPPAAPSVVTSLPDTLASDTRSRQAHPARPSNVTPPRRMAAVAPDPAVGDDSAYFSFEALHRGTEEEIRERQSIYLPLYEGRRRVIDLGCGRGEMLQLFADMGIGSYGIDTNASMVARCGKRGLEVVQEDALTHLEALDDRTLDGAFSAQVFEHWERDTIASVVKLLYRKLQEGSPFVMETQNPVSLVVGGSTFWRDFTHVRPIHPDAFEFLVEAVGFSSIEVRPLAPYPDSARLPRVRELDGLPESTLAVVAEVNRTIDALDQVLYGHRDYAVICYK